MKTLTFIRHGESKANAGGVTIKHELIPLSDAGFAQACSIADSLNMKPSIVLVSELIRTQQTAQYFCTKYQTSYQIEPLLNEFSVISHELIADMRGIERRPIANAYWQEGDVNKRMGVEADTFIEFNERITQFISKMPSLPDNTVIFGHGIWFGLLVWRLMGFPYQDSASMKKFRQFQTSLPIHNCVTYNLLSDNGKNWSVQLL